MTTAFFFNRLNVHFKAKLPFVAYRKPNETVINSFLQKTDELLFAKDFTEKGFVFSPFDAIDKTVLMPWDVCETLTLENFDIVFDEEESTHVQENIDEVAKQQHMALVKWGIEEIESGNLKKVVLSRKEEQELTHTDPFLIFKRLLNKYSKGFVYCWYHPQVGLWLGATPETLIKIEGHRFSVMALAGTQSYQGTEDVVWQHKEIEEQQYVTDFITDNIKAAVENITISEVETVKSGNLLHLKSTIAGRIDVKSTNLMQLLGQLHPTPAVCGVPKQVAKGFIIANENYNREFYTGFLGELNFETYRQPRTGKRNIEHRAYAIPKHSTQLYVNLRCMQVKGKTAMIYVGGGITKLSNPESEWEETVSKSMVIKTVL